MPRKKKYSPQELEKKIKAYFQDIDSRPMVKIKEETYKGETKVIKEYFTRPYTIEMLCDSLNILPQTLKNYENDAQYLGIITHARNKIKGHKLEGATSGMFNGNVVALDLGLKQKEEIRQNNTLIAIDPVMTQQLLQQFAQNYGSLPTLEQQPEQIKQNKDV